MQKIHLSKENGSGVQQCRVLVGRLLFRRLPKAVSLFCRLSLSSPLLFVRRDGEEEGEWQLATRVDGSRKESFVAEGWDDDPKRKDFPRLLPAPLRYIYGLDQNST